MMGKKRGEDMAERGEVYTLTQNEHGVYGVRPTEVDFAAPEPVAQSPAWMRSDETRPRDFEDPLAWLGDALCAETYPDAFTPDKGGSVADAKRICGRCTVRAACLLYALKNGIDMGIWGGYNSVARDELREQLEKTCGVTLEAVQRVIA